jgi:predicted ATPase
MLRAVSHETQVLMATHSPLVLNELRGDEISIVTRPAGGSTRVTRLCDTPNYAERSKVYQNGELWLSYGDATEERALLHGEPRP